MRYCLFAFILVSFTTCNAYSGKHIAKIPEASGISYCSKDDTLIVANDEGTYYQINRKGKILHKQKLGKYDLEGVVCEDEQILFVVENKGVLIIDSVSGNKKEVPLNPNYQGKKMPLLDKKSGIEGIAKIGHIVYLSKQSKRKKDALIVVAKWTSDGLSIIDLIKHQLSDTAGLAYHDGYLYMVSDKEDLLIKYDLEKKKSVKKVQLEEGAWEGIAFDHKGNMYLADDDGRIMKYKKKRLGL